MNKLLIISLLGLAACLAFVIPNNSNSSSSIDFTTNSLETALEKAKTTNKLVFLDVSTSWCGHCKKMKKNTYTNNDVVDYLNQDYICVSIDAEKGDGPAVARKYGVSAFPTVIVLNADGSLKDKSTGYLKPQQLLKFVKL